MLPLILETLVVRLVDINGNLVGINSMKIANEQVEGIGFAIPSNEVKVTIKELVKNGKIERPSIGIGLLNLSEIPEQYKEQLNTKRSEGVYIAKVDDDNGLKKEILSLLLIINPSKKIPMSDPIYIKIKTWRFCNINN